MNRPDDLADLRAALRDRFAEVRKHFMARRRNAGKMTGDGAGVETWVLPRAGRKLAFDMTTSAAKAVTRLR